jgi:hypothetical protein
LISNPENISKWLWQQDKDKLYQIKEYKQKRSLSQNSYAWKLITELGNVLRQSKEELYERLLNDYGQGEMGCMLSKIRPQGYFKYYRVIRTTKIDGKELTIYKILKGSSEFDSREMSIFIDGIIQECKEQGIETLTPEEIAKLNLR